MKEDSEYFITNLLLVVDRMITSVLFTFWWKRIFIIAFIVYFYKPIKYGVQAVVVVGFVVRTLILRLSNVIWLRTNEQRVYCTFLCVRVNMNFLLCSSRSLCAVALT